MPGYVIGNFFVYSVINAFTPGPGNILALNTVTNYGWRKGSPLFLGIFAGYYVVQLICAVFVYSVSTFLPGVLGVMKYVGAAYLCKNVPSKNDPNKCKIPVFIGGDKTGKHFLFQAVLIGSPSSENQPVEWAVGPVWPCGRDTPGAPGFRLGHRLCVPTKAFGSNPVRQCVPEIFIGDRIRGHRSGRSSETACPPSADTAGVSP